MSIYLNTLECHLLRRKPNLQYSSYSLATVVSIKELLAYVTEIQNLRHSRVLVSILSHERVTVWTCTLRCVKLLGGPQAGRRGTVPQFPRCLLACVENAEFLLLESVLYE